MSGLVSQAGGLRREPRQARSRARLAQILAAADAILAEEGVEALTVRRIAERAGVPVGSLYQFFPGKGSVVDAVARAYIAEFDGAVEAMVNAASSGDWSDPVGRIVDEFVALYRSHPGLPCPTGEAAPVVLQQQPRNRAQTSSSSTISVESDRRGPSFRIRV